MNCPVKARHSSSRIPPTSMAVWTLEPDPGNSNLGPSVDQGCCLANTLQALERALGAPNVTSLVIDHVTKRRSAEDLGEELGHALLVFHLAAGKT